MICHDPSSTSKLGRATHIIEARLNSFTATEWEPMEGIRLDGRLVTAEFELERFWKGEPDPALAKTVTLEFEQYNYQNGIIRFALPGVWSRHKVEAGASYVLFLNAGSSALLEEPHCFFVETAKTAIPDLSLSDRSGCPPNRLGKLLDELAPELPRFGPLFSEYAASRIPETFYRYPEDFHLLFRLLENDLAPGHLRWIWLRGIFSGLAMMDPAPPAFLARTVVGCVRLAAKSGPDLSRAVLATYLPNLLGISGGRIRKKAREVFVDLPGTAAQVTQLLGGDANLPNRDALLEWMRES